MPFCDNCLIWIDDPELCDDCSAEDWLYDQIEDYYYYNDLEYFYDNEGEKYDD